MKKSEVPGLESSGTDSLAGQAVDAIEDLSGIHPGYRRAHAKGICCRAVFRPSGLAASFTTAAHLQGQDVAAVVRFSGSSTDPVLADVLSPAKGMAVQFSLPGGGVTNLAGVTIPVFFARTPESFLDIIRSAHQAQESKLGVLELLKEITTHFAESRESLMAVTHLKPPASYAESRYYCIHAYFFIDPEGTSRPVKFEWLPDSGERTLTIDEAAAQPDDYLQDELELRLKDHPAVFQLVAVFGEAGDPTDDPTRAWPEERRRIDLGRLSITELMGEPEGLVMDPTVIPPGMALSDDPILNFRRAAYADSHHRRSQEQ